jgi:hypothetical protein
MIDWRCSMLPISKVAEDPTRYRAKRKGARKV